MNIKNKIDDFVKSVTRGQDCVLLRYDPNFVEEGKDIDILVTSSGMKQFIGNLTAQIESEGHRLVKLEFSKAFSFVFVIFVFENSKFPLYFDIRTVLNDFVVTYNDLKKLGYIRKNSDGSNELDKNAQTALLLIRNDLARRSLSEKHLKLIEGHDVEQVKEATVKLGFLLNSNGDFYKEYTVQKKNFSKLKKIYYKVIHKFFNPKYATPTYISFYGPDGAGKSTYGTLLYEDLKTFNDIYFFHYLGTVERTQTNDLKSKLKENTKLPLLRFFRFMIVRKKSFFKKYNNSTIVINDRFILDYFLKFFNNSKFSRCHANAGRLFANKKNILNVLIVDDAERIINRKPELTAVQINGVYKFLKRGINTKNNRYFSINLAEFENIEAAYNMILINLSKVNINLAKRKFKVAK